MKKTSAEVASQEALTSLFECIKNKQHFRLEAGAGAGKTYSLIKVLEELIKENKELYLKQGKKIACITYTNVAKDEIIARTDRNPIVFCETNHAFCWSLINPFQKALREQIPQLQNWKDKLEKESEDIQNKQIVYKLGYRSIKNGELSLHHDDIIDLTIKLLEEPKFRQILIEKFPIILIDEYQDTDKKWINAVKTHFLDRPASPLFGFFGDHWQKIYGDGCGLIKHSKIEEINKNANFRSSKVIVEALNEMRKELPQCISDESSDGHIHIFHTNNWEVTRQTSQHWKGDLEKEDAHKAIDKVKEYLKDQGWDFSLNKTKILMLTHKLLANAQGYSGIANAFKHNESFVKKENKYIAFFIDQLEPIVEAFINKKYGIMFNILEQRMPLLNNHSDKLLWKSKMSELIELREKGKIKEIIQLLQKEDSKIKLPESILKTEKELSKSNNTEEQNLSSQLKESKALHDISYSEIIALKKALDENSPFQTQHGVKGAEFENVLIVIGRGWNQYNFGEMLKWVGTGIPNGKEENFERNRNLFYVSCSRAKKRLAILFTQELEETAIETLNKWFDPDNIIDLQQ